MKNHNFLVFMILCSGFVFTSSAFSESKGNLRYSIGVSKFKNESQFSGAV